MNVFISTQANNNNNNNNFIKIWKITNYIIFPPADSF